MPRGLLGGDGRFWNWPVHKFGHWTKSNTKLCASSISKPIKLNKTNQDEVHWIVFDCVWHPNSIKHKPMDCVGLFNEWYKFAWTKIVFCGLENMKNTCHMKYLKRWQNCHWFSTPVLQTSRVHKSKVWFSLIFQLFLCEFDFIQLLNSVRFSSIQFNSNSVQLGLIDCARSIVYFLL